VNAIATKRKELGMTQEQAAYLLGTKQSNISAYERGVIEPGSAIEQRLSALLGLEKDTAYRNHHPTLSSLTKELRDFLAQDARTFRLGHMRSDQELGLDVDILRHVIEMNDRFNDLELVSDQQFFLSEPGSTFNSEVDALVAGMVVEWTRKTSLERIPAWVSARRRSHVQAWFVGMDGRTPLLQRRALTHGIPALRARAIFINRREFESL
jgi:transcriptional regulator with XRE-family HTH domain